MLWSTQSDLSPERFVVAEGLAQKHKRCERNNNPADAEEHVHGDDDDWLTESDRLDDVRRAEAAGEVNAGELTFSVATSSDHGETCFIDWFNVTCSAGSLSTMYAPDVLATLINTKVILPRRDAACNSERDDSDVRMLPVCRVGSAIMRLPVMLGTLSMFAISGQAARYV